MYWRTHVSGKVNGPQFTERSHKSATDYPVTFYCVKQFMYTSLS